MIKYNLLVAVFFFTASLSFSGEVEDLYSLAEKQEYQKIIELTSREDYQHKDVLRIMFIKGVALSKLNKSEQAIDHFKLMVEKFPNQAEPYNNLGVLYAKLGNYELARDALEKSNKINPKILSVHENLASLYLDMAKKEYGNVVKLGGNSAKLTCINNENLNADVKSKKSMALEDKPLVNVSSVNASILSDLEKWRKAWSDKNIDAYLSAYSKNMKVENGLSLLAWKEQRKQRLSSAGTIAVEVDSPVISIIDEKHARVSFTQKYVSNRMKDTVRKVLSFELDNNRWLIISEK
ncbi:tetratricopeptide repeat protein [Iodobacter ciconiae]|uniref:Tetratricopeptide repeat protein n=1 Tax=Iodobacter ciconiae TaxID=2496266 RepID=A0A3S8ZNP3_9NEIS|nr:tetratricopeptide repeat protein [Iodobacter ciconiae]AZN35177.1 tetratricopeptide repeat protein [Iodobacter ciconiae]